MKLIVPINLTSHLYRITVECHLVWTILVGVNLTFYLLFPVTNIIWFVIYLVKYNEFSSFHTQQIFSQKKTLLVGTEMVIYKINCLTHCKLHVGYTTTITNKQNSS